MASLISRLFGDNDDPICYLSPVPYVIDMNEMEKYEEMTGDDYYSLAIKSEFEMVDEFI